MQTSKRIVISVIVFVMGLFSLCSLNIPVIECVKLEISDTGFSLMTFRATILSEHMGLVDFCGTTALFQLIFGIASIVFAPASFAVQRRKTLKILINCFMGACLVFLFVYMVEGIIAVSVQSDYYGTAYTSAGSGSPFEFLYFDTHTLAFLNFVFGAFIYIVYTLCMYLIPDEKRKFY